MLVNGAWNGEVNQNIASTFSDNENACSQDQEISDEPHDLSCHQDKPSSPSNSDNGCKNTEIDSEDNAESVDIIDNLRKYLLLRQKEALLQETNSIDNGSLKLNQEIMLNSSISIQPEESSSRFDSSNSHEKVNRFLGTVL